MDGTRTVRCSRRGEIGEPLKFGLSTPGGLLAARELQAVADAVGRRAEMVMAFEDFFASPPIAAMAVTAYCGADPIITWEPWCWTDDRSAAVVRSIVSGALDEYLYRWADEIREWGSAVHLRFAHEFNGDWYPWSPAFGTTSATYVEAWRRRRYFRWRPSRSPRTWRRACACMPWGGGRYTTTRFSRGDWRPTMSGPC